MVRFQGVALARQCNKVCLRNTYCEAMSIEHPITSPLFRPEVTHAKQASWLGSIHLAHNPRFTVVASMALLLVGALLAFGAWGKVARKVKVPGILMPQMGTVELSATMSGVLFEQRVHEGEHVQQGQVLFVINTDHRRGQHLRTTGVSFDAKAKHPDGRTSLTRGAAASTSNTVERTHSVFVSRNHTSHARASLGQTKG